MPTHPTKRSMVAGTMAVLAALSLSGCGSNPVEDAVQNGVENAAEDAAEGAAENGSGDNVDIDIGNDVAIPDSFPSDFPLPDGRLTSAVTVDEGTQLNYELPDQSEADKVAQYFASNADFEEALNSNLGGIQTWTYTSDEYSVTIGFIPDDETSQMTYLVVRVDA